MKFFSKKEIRIIIFFLALSFFLNYLPFTSYAHLEHSSSGGVMSGDYFSYIGFEPRNPVPGETTKMIFSIQDVNGNDLHDLKTMVEIYSSKLEKRLFFEPWNERKTGDFEIPYVFEETGAYQIVLSIYEDTNVKNHIISPRSILSSSTDCNCTRIIFNASISENWNNIWNALMIIIVVLPFSVFGYALWNNYKKKSKQKTSKYETLRYIIVFLAVAGGIVHLSIYVDHVPLRVEYGIFLLLAAISQIGFGVLSLSTFLFDSTAAQKEFRPLQSRNLAINLFGLIGSVILLGLYIYVVNFPPPLSPENHPEHIEVAGIVAKSLEISLIVIIAYVINLENKLKTGT